MYIIRRFSHKIWIFWAIFFAPSVFAATPFSKYGMIQNVQNYAGTSPYNTSIPQITTPRIVNATGPTLKPADCERTVQAIVESVCRNHNNCKTTTLADVRPSIMVQLSTLPGYNYASSCAGYIDTIYENYQKRAIYAPTTPTTTAFPSAQQQVVQDSSVPKWKSEYNARAAELKALQAQNPIDTTVNDTAFPTTIADLSYQERMNLMADNYADYMDAQVYVPLNVVRTETTDGGTGGYSGTTGSNTDCGAVRNCIEQYGNAEYTAENDWFTARQEYENNPTAPNHNVLSEKTKKLEQAWTRALISPCVCTQNKDFWKMMNMQDLCKKDNPKRQSWLDGEIQKYKNKLGI